MVIEKVNDVNIWLHNSNQASWYHKTPVPRYVCLCVVMCACVLLYVPVCCYVCLCVIMCACVLLRVLVCYYVCLCIVTCACVLLNVLVYC